MRYWDRIDNSNASCIDSSLPLPFNSSSSLDFSRYRPLTSHHFFPPPHFPTFISLTWYYIPRFFATLNSHPTRFFLSPRWTQLPPFSVHCSTSPVTFLSLANLNLPVFLILSIPLLYLHLLYRFRLLLSLSPLASSFPRADVLTYLWTFGQLCNPQTRSYRYISFSFICIFSSVDKGG